MAGGHHQCKSNHSGAAPGDGSCPFGCSSLDHCDQGRCISNGESGHCSSMDHDDRYGNCVSNISQNCVPPLRWNGFGCN